MRHKQTTHFHNGILPINTNEPDTTVEIMELIDLKTGIETPDVIVEIFYRVRKD